MSVATLPTRAEGKLQELCARESEVMAKRYANFVPEPIPLSELVDFVWRKVC
jgi:hypothetical protein